MRDTDPAPVDPGDALAVLRYGEEALDPGLEARLQAALDPAPAAALVQCLDRLRRALQAHDPRQARRGVGLIGRLMGRDVQAESEALALRERMGTLVAAADRSALALERREGARRQLQGEVAAAIAALDAVVARARAWLDANRSVDGANLERRLAQLATVQATRELTARQLALLQVQDLELLARYRRIRDVLLPAWRQQALAEAGRRGRDCAMAADRTRAAIESEVDAMAGRLE